VRTTESPGFPGKKRIATWARVGAGLFAALFALGYLGGLVAMALGRSLPQTNGFLLWTAPFALGVVWLMGAVALTGVEPRNITRIAGWILLLGAIWFLGLIGP
jgi:hypothetical protein